MVLFVLLGVLVRVSDYGVMCNPSSRPVLWGPQTRVGPDQAKT